MAEHPQNRDAQAQATSASQIRPNENTSERTAWRPLRLPMFRNLLIADLVSDIGTFMQGVGAAWLLVSQGAGPLLVALTQTASALPFFLLALPAVASVATAFTLNALSFLAVLWVIARWKRPARQSGLPRETLSGATRAAIRYTRNAPEMLTVLGRIASIMFFASAFWALLPTVAHALGSSSTLYGLLLTVFGGGAVVGAMALQRVRSSLSAEATLAIGTTLFAGALWATTTFRSVVPLSVAIALGGAAWTAVMSLMSAVMQSVAPDWVRARALAVFLLVYMGSWAAGSAFWGYVAGHRGTQFSLVAAAIGTAASPVLILISRLPDATADLATWDHWRKPRLVEPTGPSEGPVLVTVEYEIDEKDSDEFLMALEQI